MTYSPSSNGQLTGTGQAVLEIEDLSVEFLTEHGWVTVVDAFNLSIGAGESVGLVGESGSGKSVTSLAVMGLIKRPGRISGGRITFEGTPAALIADGSTLTGQHLAEYVGR